MMKKLCPQLQGWYFDFALRQGYDVEKDQIFQNIANTYGLLTGVRNVLRVKEKGLLFLGLPCNSHTWVSSSQHQRGPVNPYGNQAYDFVKRGNLIAYRSALIICIGLVRGLVWLLENPSGSRCIYLPVLHGLLQFKQLLGSQQCRWWGPQTVRCFFNDQLVFSTFDSFLKLFCQRSLFTSIF